MTAFLMCRLSEIGKKGKVPSTFTYITRGLIMSLLIPSAIASASDAAPQGPSGLFQILMFGGLFLLMYLLIIRPQRKRQKEHQSLIESIAKGNEVVTAGGILGKVTKADGDYILLQVSDNVELKIQKTSIHAVLPKGTIKSI